MRLKTLVMATAAGAAIAYFMDSERGAQRRAAAKEKAEHLKAQAMPKLQELRHQASELTGPAAGELENAYAGNGATGLNP